MSKLEKLIQQYCPDGVEYRSLGDVCIFADGFPLKADDIKGQGIFPVVKIGNINNGVIDEQGCYLTSLPSKVKTSQILSGGEILVGMSGSTGKTGYSVLQNAIVNQRIAIIRNNDLVLNGYLKHSLVNNNFESYCFQKGTGPQHNISKFDLLSYKIPVPPLPVQEEIVRVLDAFTELQAELQKRLQQYNYYRDNLLTNFTPEQASKEYTLGEVTVDIYSGATPSKEKREYWVNGTIPWMSSGEVNLGQVYEVEGRITQLGYDKCSTKMVPEGSVVIALAGQGKTRGTVAILRTSVCTNQSLAALVPQKEIVSGEYLYYYLKTQYAKLREVSAGDGTRGGLNLKMLKAYKVVIPSHKAQDQIVAILDRFDTLTTDLIQGLPAEIEKRRQQYEFYRDKLLTFKRKDA